MRKAVTLLPVLLSIAASPAYGQVVGRAELRAGYDEPRGEIRRDEFEIEEFGSGGIALGAEVGVDGTIGAGVLIGAYAGADWSQADGCERDVFFTEDDEELRDEACIDAGRSLFAGVRAGLTVIENGLVYVKGGYSNAKFRASYNDPGPVSGFVFEDSDTLGGWHLGAGFEVGLSRKVYVKAEYIHHWYDDAFTDVLIAPENAFEPTRHQLMAGVGIRFGGAAPPPPPPPPPAPPPPPPPATQTCPDGMVILATETCPAPPPPPPPPPPAPERG